MKIIYKLLNLPKTLFFNFYYLPLKQAIKLPFRVSYKTKICRMGKRSSVRVLDCTKKISLGISGSFNLNNTGSYWDISSEGVVTFCGETTIGRGFQLICDGKIIFGNNFYANSGLIINAGKEIKIGQDCLLGWNITILDGDGHKIIHNGNQSPTYDEINISDRVWIASNVTLLKGSSIPSNSVVAYGSLVTKKIQNANVLIGGNNKVLQEDIYWIK